MLGHIWKPRALQHWAQGPRDIPGQQGSSPTPCPEQPQPWGQSRLFTASSCGGWKPPGRDMTPSPRASVLFTHCSSRRTAFPYLQPLWLCLLFYFSWGFFVLFVWIESVSITNSAVLGDVLNYSNTQVKFGNPEHCWFYQNPWILVRHRNDIYCLPFNINSLVLSVILRLNT